MTKVRTDFEVGGLVAVCHGSDPVDGQLDRVRRLWADPTRDERFFSGYSEDDHITRFFRFSEGQGETFSINGVPTTTFRSTPESKTTSKFALGARLRFGADTEYKTARANVGGGVADRFDFNAIDSQGIAKGLGTGRQAVILAHNHREAGGVRRNALRQLGVFHAPADSLEDGAKILRVHKRVAGRGGTMQSNMLLRKCQ